MISFAEECEMSILSYCLMGNHVHLLLRESKDNLSQFMKKIKVSHALYFNKKYNRVGHLFQDRFKSKVVLSEAYLVACSSYIHRNPVEAGLAVSPEKYRWSSYAYFLRLYNSGPVDTEAILSVFSENRNAAIKSYIEYHYKDKGFSFISAEDDDDYNDSSDIVTRYLVQLMNTPDKFPSLSNQEKTEIVLALINDYKLSYRAIAQGLSVSKDAVFRIVKNSRR